MLIRYPRAMHDFSMVTFCLFRSNILQFFLFISMFFLPLQVTGSESIVEDIVIADFSRDGLQGWQEKEFDGQTQYKLVRVDGKRTLHAEANASASGLFKEIHVDLRTHPYLSWQWQVERGHSPLAEREKEGDDYAARLYVIVDGGLFFWKARAVNYVWSSSQPVGSVWANAFAGKNVMLLAQRGPDDEIGKWYREKRNVYDDLKALLGEEINAIDAVAVMTDSDNSKGTVCALYGEIRFSAE